MCRLPASGFFFDDQFNPNGATESAGTLSNLGLSKEEGAVVSGFYWAHMNKVYSELLKRGKFAWQLLWTGQKDCAYKDSYSCLGTTGTNILIEKKNCASKIRTFCTAGSDAQTRAMVPPPSPTPSQQQQQKPHAHRITHTHKPKPHTHTHCRRHRRRPSKRGLRAWSSRHH